jgi:hypothetical protein
MDYVKERKEDLIKKIIKQMFLNHQQALNKLKIVVVLVDLKYKFNLKL